MAQLTAPEVRRHLRRALEDDLVGPFDPREDGSSEEVLPLPRWYLTGFLVPERDREPELTVEGQEKEELEVEDPTADEGFAAGSDEDAADAEPGSEPEPKQKKLLPASIGLRDASTPAARRVARWAGGEVLSRPFRPPG